MRNLSIQEIDQVSGGLGIELGLGVLGIPLVDVDLEVEGLGKLLGPIFGLVGGTLGAVFGLVGGLLGGVLGGLR